MWEFGQFELHTKSFGSAQMKKMGWTYGTGLGKNKNGNTEPVEIKEKTKFDKMTRIENVIWNLDQLMLDDYTPPRLFVPSGNYAEQTGQAPHKDNGYWFRLEHRGEIYWCSRN